MERKLAGASTRWTLAGCPPVQNRAVDETMRFNEASCTDVGSAHQFCRQMHQMWRRNKGNGDEEQSRRTAEGARDNEIQPGRGRARSTCIGESMVSRAPRTLKGHRMDFARPEERGRTEIDSLQDASRSVAPLLRNDNALWATTRVAPTRQERDSFSRSARSQ